MWTRGLQDHLFYHVITDVLYLDNLPKGVYVKGIKGEWIGTINPKENTMRFIDTGYDNEQINFDAIVTYDWQLGASDSDELAAGDIYHLEVTGQTASGLDFAISGPEAVYRFARMLENEETPHKGKGLAYYAKKAYDYYNTVTANEKANKK